MTLQELVNITNRSEKSLTTSFCRTKERLSKIGLFIDKKENNNYILTFHPYWEQPEIENFPRLSYKDMKRPGALEEYNKKYNKLTLLYRIADTKKNYWCCECECGNYTKARLDSIKDNSIMSCGCYNREVTSNNYKDLTGQNFGYLSVISLSNKKQPNHKGKIWQCKCNKCGREDVYIRADTLQNSISCGCIKSKGETLIIQLLTNEQIKFEKEKTFSNLKTPTGAKLRFDFYLPDYNCLIEYDGIQHFQYDNNFWNTEENYNQTKKYDNYKNQWSKDNHFILIRIPYTKYSTLKTEDLLPQTSQYIQT